MKLFMGWTTMTAKIIFAPEIGLKLSQVGLWGASKKMAAALSLACLDESDSKRQAEQ